MTKKRRPPARARRAVVKQKPVGNEQVNWLLHELQVHSEEITVQNEQLVKAQAEIEQARDRYAELYDFAPLGYLSLDEHCNILECNFAVCALLSRSRQFLLNVPLSSLLISPHRPLLREFVRESLHNEHGPASIDVQVKQAPQRFLRLFGRPRPAGTGSQLLFTAIMDVTVERQLENERSELLAREQTKSRQLAIEVTIRARAEQRIKSLLERLVTVQEEERRRLARELHDELGQQLTALRLTLSMLRQVSGNDETRQQIEIADGIAMRLDRDVDYLAWALRPAALDEFGLVPALTTFIRQWSEFHRIPAELRAEDGIPRLAVDIENHFYRIVQEALNNVVKHAHATEATITLRKTEQRLYLSIHDNGEGFDMVAARRAPGMGLLGMRERAALLGGDFEVESAAGRGTTVTAQVPLPRPTS
jgi:PAS domain S-box-containing protein